MSTQPKSTGLKNRCAIYTRKSCEEGLDLEFNSLFVDRLATAPQNRDKLVKSPVFRGGGTGLLLYAVAQSYFLGFEGRVNLFPVTNEHFYTQLGFQPTKVTVSEDVLFELPAARALDLLQAKGLIDG